MASDGFSYQVPDLDPAETTEWVDSMTDVVRARDFGPDRPPS